MAIDLICLDADDTLWHNMRHFKAAEQAFTDLVTPFTDAGVPLAHLHAVEERNLALYGYGAKSFTLSMIETATQLLGDRLTAATVADLLAVGRTLLAHPVELLPGTREILEALAQRGRLVLVTKGDLLHQEAKIAASGVGELFSGIEIVSDKTVTTFQTLFRKYGVAAEGTVMAGDSMRSDILPALAAGAWAAFIPQDLAWHHESAAPPTSGERFCRLDSLADLPAWIDRIG